MTQDGPYQSTIVGPPLTQLVSRQVKDKSVISHAFAIVCFIANAVTYEESIISVFCLVSGHYIVLGLTLL